MLDCRPLVNLQFFPSLFVSPLTKKTRPVQRTGLVGSSGSVSRVLFPLRGGGHLSGADVAGSLERPTRKLARRAASSSLIWPFFGRGLPSQPGHPSCWWALTPPFHLYPANLLPLPLEERRDEVVFSQFPISLRPSSRGRGLKPTGKSILCGTFLPVARSWRYPPSCPAKLGLSSPRRKRPPEPLE